MSPWVDVARVAIANSDEIKARRAKKLATMTRRGRAQGHPRQPNIRRTGVSRHLCTVAPPDRRGRLGALSAFLMVIQRGAANCGINRATIWFLCVEIGRSGS